MPVFGNLVGVAVFSTLFSVVVGVLGVAGFSGSVGVFSSSVGATSFAFSATAIVKAFSVIIESEFSRSINFKVIP